MDAFSNASITAVLRWNRKSEMLFAFLRRCSKFAGLVASVLRESNLTVRVSAVSLITLSQFDAVVPQLYELLVAELENLSRP